MGNVGLLVIVGFLIHKYQGIISAINRKAVILGLIISLVLLWGPAELIIELTSLPAGLLTYVKAMLAIVIFVSVLHEERIQKIFEERIITGIGKISFPVFGFHWPIMCSAGVYILCICIDNYIIGFFLALLATLAITLVVSVVFHITIEKWTSKLIQQLQKITVKRER